MRRTRTEIVDNGMVLSVSTGANVFTSHAIDIVLPEPYSFLQARHAHAQTDKTVPVVLSGTAASLKRKYTAPDDLAASTAVARPA